MIIQDAHIRKQALTISQSFIVQAPAGSGKTELLTQRYLNLLAHAEKAPEEIIAITFTRKAASEMRARIIKALYFAQETEPKTDDYRHQTWSLAKKVLHRDESLHWDILQNPNRLRILTIDALSALLCKQTPLHTQFGGNIAVSDYPKALYQLAAQRAISLFIEAPYQPLIEQLLLYLDNRVDHLENLFAELLDQRDQWLPAVLYCHTQQHSLRETLENSLKRVVLEKMQIAANGMPPFVRQLLVLCVRHAGDYLQKNNATHPIAECANFIWEEEPALDKFKSWFGLANLLVTQEGEWRKSIDVRNGFEPKDPNKSLLLSVLTELQSHPAFLENIRDILICPPTTYSTPQWETLTTLTQLLPLLAAQLTVIFQEKKQIDFTELNLAALKALGTEDSPTDLALYLDYQIRHLLIDEFQDTSITHLQLIEKIIKEWQPDDGRTLFLVGDPMQSIYRFRNAEVGLFLRAQTQGIGSVSLIPLTLTMNFRSQATLVNWFNDAFQTVFPAVSDIATGRVPYTKSVAAKEAIDHGVQCYSRFENDEAAPQTIINTLKKIKEQNLSDSFAILVRSRALLTPIIALLNAEQLPFQAIDIEPLFSRPEIQDLLSLTRALHHRADRIAWFALLRAPFCGLLLSDIERLALYAEKSTVWEAIIAHETLVELSTDAKNRLKRLQYFLQEAFDTQSQHSLSSWIEGVWLALGGSATLNSPSELDYTRAYFDLLEKLGNESNTLSIEKLMDRCKILFANAKSSEKNAIQLMTIHKSKGLEFDHVFLPGLERHTPKDSTKLLRFCDRPSLFGGDDLLMAPIASAKQNKDPIYEYLKEIESEKQYHEMSRLLYVAATRAKKSLHLLFELRWDEKKLCIKTPTKGTFLEKLWPLYKSDIHITPNSAKEIAINPVENLPIVLQRLVCSTALPENIKPFIPVVQIDISLPETDAQIVGMVVHDALQKITDDKTNAMSEKQWAARLHGFGMLPTKIPQHINTISLAIKNTLKDPRGQWILSPHHSAKSEWALTTVINNTLKQKIIDRSFIDDNNVRWIIDYKTSTPKECESLQEFLEKQKTEYQAQLEAYADLIAQQENNPIQLGLYFPLCQQWIEWNYNV